MGMTWTDPGTGRVPSMHRPSPSTAYRAFVDCYCKPTLPGRHLLPGKGCLLLLPWCPQPLSALLVGLGKQPLRGTTSVNDCAKEEAVARHECHTRPVVTMTTRLPGMREAAWLACRSKAVLAVFASASSDPLVG